MTLGKEHFTLDKVTGNIKPFILFVATIVVLIVTIIRDYKRYHQTYVAHPISEVHKIGSEEVELTRFVIKKELMAGLEKGGVALYNNPSDQEPVAILIVPDVDDFLKIFHEKGRVLAKQFSGGVTANTDNGVKEFINAPGMKTAYNQYLKIFKMEMYFSWKTVIWQYVILMIGIAFLGLLLVSRIRVY